ncbi:MAG: diguanylate cyclase domain-containing protein [Lachnospiraceae bacterium]
MDFEEMEQLVDEPLFEYNRDTGTLRFMGKYKKYLHTQQQIPSFFETGKKTKLIEPDTAKKMKRKWDSQLKEKEVVSMQVPMLASGFMYEMFNINGIYDSKSNTISGVIHNIEAERRMFRDSLTGLYNRVGMEHRISEILDQTTQDSWSVLYLIDLDNFKEVNDTKGHLFGDELLKEVANVLLDVFGEETAVGRIGGDEYLAYCYGMNNEEMVDGLAAKVCLELEREFEQKNYSVTSSIGISVAKKFISYQTMFSQADAALYVAKCEGKNGFKRYTPKLRRTQYQNRRNQQNNQTQGNDQKNFFLEYQFLVSAVMDAINGEMPARETIEMVARILVENFHVTRAYVCCYLPDRSGVGKSWFYEKEGEGDGKNVPFRIKSRPTEHVQNFNEEGVFFCTDVTKVHEPIRTELLRMKVKSLLQCLIYDEEDNVIGLLGLNNCDKKRFWEQDEIEMVKGVAKILTPTVRRMHRECAQEYEQELKK